MELPRFAAVGLSLMLAANCFMPCYTLAYADESQEVADVPEEEQEEIAGDAGGLEFSPGGVESNADAADGGRSFGNTCYPELDQRNFHVDGIADPEHYDGTLYILKETKYEKDDPEG